VRHALPTTLAVADAMSPVLAHGDLIQQNVLSTARGIVAVDWERAGVASPATDLAIVEPATYCDEMHLLGLEADIDSIRRGAFAGRVLSALTHDIAAKRPKKQRRYLERMRAATEALIGTGGPA
jgi:aminoglycoside phosphotransferase (APT) family kinase protein